MMCESSTFPEVQYQISSICFTLHALSAWCQPTDHNHLCVKRIGQHIKTLSVQSLALFQRRQLWIPSSWFKLITLTSESSQYWLIDNFYDQHKVFNIFSLFCPLQALHLVLIKTIILNDIIKCHSFCFCVVRRLFFREFCRNENTRKIFKYVLYLLGVYKTLKFSLVY